CFTFGTPAEIAEHVRNYKAAIKRCKRPIGEYINDNIAVTTNMFCLGDGDRARHLYSKARVEAFTEFFFGWRDSIPRPKGFPREGPIKVPPSTPEELKAGLAVGGRQIGAPEEIVRVIEMYEALGVDQLIYAPLTLTLDQQYVLESIETFGKHVLPKFDTDAVHRTTRQREAAREAPGLVDLTIAETGAVRAVAETQQVGAVAVRLARAAELAAVPADEPLPPRGNAHGLVAREPIGVVACITPFNFPMTNCAGKMG